MHAVSTSVSNSKFKTSTKLEMLADEIRAIPRDEKVVVFSQYTRMLELAAFRLRQDGVELATLTVAQNMIQRGNILASFTLDPNFRVLLVSLKAGGEGLNLQVANNVILLDPWWNPAAELQAIQRVHRIGQRKPVRAVKLAIEKSIETRILALQEKTHLGFEAIVGQSQPALNLLKHEDLVFLSANFHCVLVPVNDLAFLHRRRCITVGCPSRHVQWLRGYSSRRSRSFHL